MPSYEYQCPVHGTFEEFQSITAPPLEECPQCTKEGRQQWECKTCHALVFTPKDVEPSACAACAGSFELPKQVKPKKLISLTSFTLVGSGWAKDNYSK